MDKSVPELESGDVDSTRPMATYMPSLGSRAPMFVKSSSAFDYTMYGSDDISSKPSPTNPPVTPWDDGEEERGFSPALSPVNMLLATDLSEVVNGRGNRSFDPASSKAGARWPYLKQQAARHVYGNLRSRLQNRDSVSPPAVCMTCTPDAEFNKPLDGIQIQTFGIKPKSEPSDSTLRPLLPKEMKPFEKKKNYRISFKVSEGDKRGCVSAPPPTAEKPNPNEVASSNPSHQPRRSKTAREYYRPKRDPLVKFDTKELPTRLQQDNRHPLTSRPVPSRVTWTDVMTAKSDGVYRESGGLGGRTHQSNGSQVRLYLSSELWGILDEDISAVKAIGGKS